MDPLSLGFLALVIVLGAVIALVSDRVGRKLGKQRRSLFGLRPRHTAELLIVVGGLLIPFVTVAILMSASSDMRQWLFEGRKAIEQAKQLQGKVANLEQREVEANRKLSEIAERVDTLSKRERDARAAATKAQGEVTRLSAQRTELQRTYDRVKGELASVRKELVRRRAELTKALSEYGALKLNYEELERVRADAEEANLNLIQDVRRLERDEQDLKTRLDGLSKEVTDKERELKEAETRYQTMVAGYQADIEKAINERKQAEQDLVRARQFLYLTLDVARTRPMTFRMGEELGRQNVPAALTAQQAGALLQSFLRTVRTGAQARGASGRSVDEPAAVVPDYTDPAGKTVTTQQQMDQLTGLMTGAGLPRAVIARATFNVFVGEAVPLDVVVVENPVVFRQNQILAEGRVDGSLADEAIVQQITAFLQGPVSERAKEAGMIPVNGSAAPYGEVGSDLILTLVQQIRSIGRAVRLVAYAEGETRAAGPLRLGLRLR